MKIKVYSLFFFFSIGCLQTIAQVPSKNDSIINIATSLINQDSVEQQLQWLQDMGTRFLIAPNHKEVAENIKSKFESFGMTEVRLDSFQCYTNIDYSILHYDTSTWQYNVEAKIIGSLFPDEEILIMGHHDNVQLTSNPELFCPGADDNASGTVAVLETARVLLQMGYQPEKTIVFLTTAAEELMNFGDAGSRYYAEQASLAGRNIWGVINNDMIAYDNGSNVIGFSNIIGSEEITGVAALVATKYTFLSPDIPPPHSQSGADLQSFIEQGYSGLYLMEDVFNPFYHTDQDLVENCDIPYLTEVIKIGCGTILYSDISLNIEEVNNEMDIFAWPNPCRDQLNISLNEGDDKLDVVLLNIAGQTVYSTDMQANQILNISMDNYPAGLYIVKFISRNSVTTRKIIKE